MKTVSEALKYFANLIWAIGNSNHEGQQCIIPVAYDDIEAGNEYKQASDIVYQNLHATHFDIHWKDKGKNIILRLYKGDSFGACLDLKFIEERIIEVNNDLDIHSIINNLLVYSHNKGEYHE